MSIATRYRLAIIFGAAWLLFALFCLVTTLSGGHPPAGALLWLIAISLTLSGRLVLEISGTEGLMSQALTILLLSLAEVMLIGAAIGLALEKTRKGTIAGASILLVYVVAHVLVAPIGASRAVLALRLRSTSPVIFNSALDRIRLGPERRPADVDPIVEQLSLVADRPDSLWRLSRALDTVTELKGSDFWRSYLQGAQGRASSAWLCENVLASAERSTPHECKPGREAMSKQLDELTAEVARCYVRELRAGRPGADKLRVLARYFPWVIDEYRDLLLEELPSGNSNWGFGTPSDPRNPCYVQGKKSLLVQGGIHLKGKSREELASVLDYWHACPYERTQRRSLSLSSCR